MFSIKHMQAREFPVQPFLASDALGLGEVWSKNTKGEPKYWGFYMVKRNV